MGEYKPQRACCVEIAKDIYAAIIPAEDLVITDAGIMDNFSNSAYINRGKGLICDTCFDLPPARDLTGSNGVRINTGKVCRRLGAKQK